VNQAITYTRVSSREQQQEGFSLEAQSKTLTDYASRKQYNVVRMREDVETAKKSGRTQFNEMVKWLKRNRSCRVLLVEKTDRPYRNLRDAGTLEDLDIEIHLVKEGQIVSKDSKSQAKFMHGMNLVMAKHYSDNLREEVKKGMREKASQGTFPGLAPFGYLNNKGERTIDVDPVCSPMVTQLFDLYATGAHTLSTLRKFLKTEYGKTMSKANVHLVLQNKFYTGTFKWGGETFTGTHPLFINPKTFAKVQAVMEGHNRPKYSKRDAALRGLLNCANDGCQLTVDIQKEKYVYYRCTGHKGKCDLPRFREEDLTNRLGESIKGLQVPPEVVTRVVAMLKVDEASASGKANAERTRLESRLTAVRNRIDAAYIDKLDGRSARTSGSARRASGRRRNSSLSWLSMASEVWIRRVVPCQRKSVSNSRIRPIHGMFRRNRTKRPNCSECLFRTFSWGEVSVEPSYVYPFDVIAERAKMKKWSGRLDSNQRPPAPEAGALPDCATPRTCVPSLRW
jgi:site-specific DNA recombinase